MQRLNDLRFPEADLPRLLAYVTDLELEVDRLRRHNRLIHQEVQAALDHVRDLCTYTAQPDGPPVPLVEVAPGRYRSAGVVPTGASWKAMVYLARGPELIALPVSFPPDPEYGSQGAPLEPDRQGPFVPSQRLLTSEAHDGPPGVAAAAYTALLGLWGLWLGLLLYAGRAVSARADT